MWAKTIKKFCGLGLCGLSYASSALPVFPLAKTCSATTPYRSPAAMQKINYMGQNKPVCKDEFLDKLKISKMDESCKAVLRRMVAFAENHVRPIGCDVGMMNAMFLSKKVFVTNAHFFYDPKNLNVKKSDADIGRCYVSRMDKEKKWLVRDFVDTRAPLKIGDPSDGGTDHAVASLVDRLDDVEDVDVDKMFLKKVSEGDELWIMSANSAFPETRNCPSISVGSCNAQGPILPADGDFSTLYPTDCPGEKGTSGSPIFALKKDASGKCVDFGIVALQAGEDTRQPNGSKYHYPENENDPLTMWAGEVGIDNKFRQNITEVLQDSQRREYSESQPVRSKVPAGQDL